MTQETPNRSARQRWQERYEKSRVRDADFTTLSGMEVDPAYGPADEDSYPNFENIGYPGTFPYTRELVRRRFDS